MSRFDAHIHLFERGFSGERAPGAELADYLAARERHDIGDALVVGYEGDARFAGNNDYILRLAGEHEWIVPLAFLDAASATPDAVGRALDAGAAGFSMYLGTDGSLAEVVPLEVWRAIDEAGVLLSLNAGPGALSAFAEVAGELGATTVLISHLGLPGPGAPANEPLTRLAAHPDVLVKLSGLYAIDPVFPHAAAAAHVEAVLGAFGAGRVVWGSDFSPGLDVVSEPELFAVPGWATALLTETEFADVLGGTLRRIAARSRDDDESSARPDLPTHSTRHAHPLPTTSGAAPW